jgi:hypothetical protein
LLAASPEDVVIGVIGGLTLLGGCSEENKGEKLWLYNPEGYELYVLVDGFIAIPEAIVGQVVEL